MWEPGRRSPAIRIRHRSLHSMQPPPTDDPPVDAAHGVGSVSVADNPTTNHFRPAPAPTMLDAEPFARSHGWDFKRPRIGTDHLRTTCGRFDLLTVVANYE